MKAFIYAQGEEIVLGHSVERLCHFAARFDKEFTDKASVWSILDGFHTPTRYPNSVPDSIPARVYTKQAALLAVALADQIVDFVKFRIPND